MNAEPMKDQDVTEARPVEMPHWAPPEAPMEMPRQHVEAQRRERVSLQEWLQRVVLPGQKA